jgi:cysteine desulfurase/selenocysteine lyase
MEEYEERVQRARLAVLAHVSHVTGKVRPVADFSRACRDAGALSLIDASQAIGRMPVDVKAIGCDFLVFSSHNLFCPPGVGVLYVREEAAAELVPFLFGGGGVNRVDAGGSFFAASDRPWRFEPGPINIGGAVALGAMCRELEKLGMSRIEAREREMRREMLAAIEPIEGVRILGPGGDGLGVLSIATDVSKLFANDHLAVVLSDRFRVIVRAGCLHGTPMLHRLSAGEAISAAVAPYNDRSDIEALALGLSVIQRALAKSA